MQRLLLERVFFERIDGTSSVGSRRTGTMRSVAALALILISSAKDARLIMDSLSGKLSNDLFDPNFLTMDLDQVYLEEATIGKPASLLRGTSRSSPLAAIYRPSFPASWHSFNFLRVGGFRAAGALAAKHYQNKNHSHTLLSGHAHFDRVPRGVLGPPTHFEPLQVGTQFLSVSRECSVSGNQINFEVVRRSSRPAIFHVGGFLSEAECNHISASADAQKFFPNPGNVRTNCGATTLSVDSDEVLAAISSTCEQLFLQPEILEPSDWSSGTFVEDMVVIKYADGGECKLHHDCTEGRHRVITVILYLESVGETWFPLALQDPSDAESVAHANPPFVNAMAAAANMQIGRGGVVVAPKKGDAVIFYNYFDDGSGEFDGLALHAGLPAPGNKSIATLFYRVDQKRH